ncbi:nuclear transport factor 2 family protein [Spirosoma foliorum]|uniref:Nuclear transport factor 2 family protein n=1 Tax=Spirosoma foliorum TaxID=2710596 RepID=A0A7G5H1K3_9BACT|nr:nuclear transport factor 2 family protein [Spirosoma foliorum]QMW04995.1 nuclear transport factor 2 family protein [Spirosoma foliorum]
MEEDEINTLIAKHFTVWSDRNGSTRREAIEQLYSNDILVIAHYRFNGLPNIDAYIGNLLSERPQYSFAQRTPVESHHNIARVNWQFGPPADPARVTGQDIFTFEAGKIQSLLVFLDIKKNQ